MLRYLFTYSSQFLFLIFTQLAMGQTSTVFGNNAMAKDCFLASQIAATTGYSSQRDLDNCNDAILQGNLNSRDVVATYVNRGIIKVALSDITGGMADYETALKLRPNDAAEAYVNRANLRLLAKQYNLAIDDYNKALEMEVSKPHIAVLNLGLAYEYLGDLSEAKKHYQQALETVPEWSVAIEKLARVNRKLGNAE